MLFSVLTRYGYGYIIIFAYVHENLLRNLDTGVGVPVGSGKGSPDPVFLLLFHEKSSIPNFLHRYPEYHFLSQSASVSKVWRVPSASRVEVKLALYFDQITDPGNSSFSYRP